MEVKSMFWSIRARQEAARNEVLYDRRGRARTAVTLPGHRAGEHPANYGKKLPAEILTSSEVMALMNACARRGPSGLRNRAIIAVMWRGGLRAAEVLALELRDVDRDNGTLTIRHGKGNRRRVVGIDPPAFAIVERWLEARRGLGVPRGAPLFCTVTRPDPGGPVSTAAWRSTIATLGRRAGIEKRVHSHGLRHTMAVELMREGVSPLVISKQLGHASLAVTQRYLEHLEPREVVEIMQARPWPGADVPAPSAPPPTA